MSLSSGCIYNRVFDLFIHTGTTNPIELYINDNSERESLAAGLSLNLTVTRFITDFLHNVNPYIDCCRRTHGNILSDMPIGNEVPVIISTERERFIPKCIAIWKVAEKNLIHKWT